MSIHERIVPVEVQTGVAKVRSIESPLVEAPSLEDDSPVAWTERRFDRLYGIQFVLETRHRDGKTDAEDRGSLLVAVRADAADLLRLDDALRSHLARLSASAFSSPLAGIVFSSAPLDHLAEISVEPSWTCAGVDDASRRATVYSRVQKKGPDGRFVVSGTSSRGHAGGAIPTRLCPLLDRALAGVLPDEIRTTPLPLEVMEQSFWLESSNSLPSEARRTDLPDLPSGVHYTRRTIEGGGSGVTTRVAGDGSEFDSTHTIGGIEWHVTTIPSNLSPDLPALGIWIGRFGFEQAVRKLGAQPSRKVERDSILVGLIPLAPPPIEKDGIIHEASDPVSIRLDAEAFVAEVVRRLDVASSPDLTILEDAVSREPAGLLSDGWLLALCRSDGTATFGFPPAAARSAIRNAALFCASLESRLP